MDNLHPKPVDRTALDVIRRGIHWASDPRKFVRMKGYGSFGHSREPLPTRPPNRTQARLIGMRFGHFRVIGVLRDNFGSKTHYVCRCDCGCYEYRALHTIKKALDNSRILHSACAECRYRASIQARQFEREHGLKRSREEFL